MHRPLRRVALLASLLTVLIGGTARAGDDLIFADGFDPAPPPPACGWNTAPGTPGETADGSAGATSALYPWRGALYVGGSAGDSFNGAAGGLAAMDPLDYSATTLGGAELVDGFVNAFVPYDAGDGEKLYVLGAFNGIDVAGSALPNSRVLVSFDGTAIGTLPDAPLQSLDFLWSGQTFGGKLVVAGSRGAVDPPQKPLLMLWDGTTWQTWSDEFSGTVAPVILTSAVFQGTLYIGGRFSGVQQSDGAGGQTTVASSNLLAFDGAAFATVGGGLKRATSTISQVLALATFDDGTGEALYIGGRFDESVDGTPLFAVAKWDGTAFSAVGSGFPMPNEVRGLTVYDDGSGPALYASGNFTATVAGDPVNHLAKWNGTTWTEVGGGTGATPGPMTVLPSTGLIVGGSFTDVGAAGIAGSGPAGGLAYWGGDCATQ